MAATRTFVLLLVIEVVNVAGGVLAAIDGGGVW